VPRATKWCLTLATLFLGALLLPDTAWAWGPATHLYYGLTVLGRLGELTETVRDLLVSQALPYLYGCVGADIFLAKKLGRARTHSHNWANGFRLVREAPSPRIRSFALGYVSHLAADTISHNCFVPSKTIEAYSSGISRHMIWELKFDKKVTTKKTLRLLKDIAKGDFADCDAHLSDRVPTRILDFSFNKQVFNHLLSLQSLSRWQALWEKIGERGPWPLKDREVREYNDRSIAAVMSYLNQQEGSQYLGADPVGEHRLRSARKLRMHYRRRLRNNDPPAALNVLATVERFAREPFQPIHPNDHRDS
jgi:hypothetical protein